MSKFFSPLLSILFLLFPDPIFAEVNRNVQYVYVGSNSTVEYLADHYKKRFKIVEGDGSEPINRVNERIHLPISFGYHIEDSILSQNGYSLGASFDAAIGFGGITYPNGLSNFVEKVSVRSKNFEINPSLMFSSEFFNNQLIFELRGGYSFICSEEVFRLGTWKIFEEVKEVIPSATISLILKPKFSPRIGYFANIKYFSREPYANIGVRFFK